MLLIKQKFSFSLFSFRPTIINTEMKARDSPTYSIWDLYGWTQSWPELFARWLLKTLTSADRYDTIFAASNTRHPPSEIFQLFALKKSVWCAPLKMTLFNRNFMNRSICAYYIHYFKNFQSIPSHPNSVKTFTVNPLSQLKAETLALDFFFASQLYRCSYLPVLSISETW